MWLYSTWPVTSSRGRVYSLLFCGCDRIPRPKATSGRESLFWHMATAASGGNGGGSRTLRGRILNSKQEAESANWEWREPRESQNLCPVIYSIQQDCTSPVLLTGTEPKYLDLWRAFSFKPPPCMGKCMFIISSVVIRPYYFWILFSLLRGFVQVTLLLWFCFCGFFFICKMGMTWTALLWGC